MKNELKKCSTCGAEIAASAKACPSCGAKQKKPFYKKWWFWVILVVLVGGAAGSGGSSGGSGSKGGVSVSSTPGTSTQQPTTQVEEPAVKPEKLEIVGDITVERDMFSTTLSGILKNNSSRDYGYVQISFNLYDADGNLIDTAFDNINNLSSGGTWKFKAIGLNSDDAVSWELGDITGW